MTEVVFNQGKKLIMDDAVAGDDLRCLLLGGASVPAGCLDPDLDHVSDLLAVSGAAELSATSYARQTLASIATSVDDANNRAAITCATITFTTLGLSDGSEGPARGIVFYKHHASGDSSRLLLSIHTTNFPKALNASNFTVTVPNDLIRGT